MRVWSWTLVGAVIAACSQPADPAASRGRVPGAPAASGGARAVAPMGVGSAVSGVSAVGSQANAEGNLILSTATAGAGAAGATAAGSGAEVLPNGCEVGKFCPPQEADPPNCGTLTLKQDVEVTRTPGNLLVLFDQSLSMGEPWGNGGMSKLQAAQSALANAIMSLQDSLTVGALFFPTYACIPVLPPPPGGAVAPMGGEGQIAFQPGPMFLQAWTQHWNTPSISLGIGTPMQEAFDRADAALKSAMLKGGTAVVAVTDGQPTCFPDESLTMTPTALETQRATTWLADNAIKTYVVGLPGAAGVQVLNDVAVAGGSMQYILPDDPAMLEAKLREVVEETVKTKFDSCAINLTPAADPADKLLMIVIEAKDNMKRQVPHVLTPEAGWTITPDGTHVEITGDLCADAKNGRFTSITFEYACKQTLPPPPITPPS